MTTPLQVEDNPAKPYKAIAAFAGPGVVAFLDYVIQGGKDEMPAWLLLLLGGLAAAAAAYAIKNPKRVKHNGVVRDQRGASLVSIVIAVLVVLFLLWAFFALLHRA